jgi:hypothetical protein
MTDQSTALDDALERVIEAARAHLAAVKAADGAIDDDDVWRSYVALNNASYAYDQQMLDSHGEVTPWDTEEIDLAEDAEDLWAGTSGEPATDPYPSVVSVRQRRDYRVPSVSALLAASAEAIRGMTLDDEEVAAPETVAEAVLGLLQAGDGSLGALDVPALDPLDGLVTVTEVAEPLDLSTSAETDGSELFQTGSGDRTVGRLDEHPYLDLEDLEPAREGVDLRSPDADASDGGAHER